MIFSDFISFENQSFFSPSLIIVIFKDENFADNQAAIKSA